MVFSQIFLGRIFFSLRSFSSASQPSSFLSASFLNHNNEYSFNSPPVSPISPHFPSSAFPVKLKGPPPRPTQLKHVIDSFNAETHEPEDEATGTPPFSNLDCVSTSSFLPDSSAGTGRRASTVSTTKSWGSTPTFRHQAPLAIIATIDTQLSMSITEESICA